MPWPGRSSRQTPYRPPGLTSESKPESNFTPRQSLLVLLGSYLEACLRRLGVGAKKERMLAHLDRKFSEEPEKAALAKAIWLTQRGRLCARWGNLLRARQHMMEALAHKTDFFPAHLGLVAIYRQQAKDTGLLSLLELAKQTLEEMPQRMRVLQTEIGLDQCGGEVHAEWANIHLYRGEWEQATQHLSLALAHHRKAQELDREHLSLLQDLGCRPMAGQEEYLRRVLDGVSRMSANMQ